MITCVTSLSMKMFVFLADKMGRISFCSVSGHKLTRTFIYYKLQCRQSTFDDKNTLVSSARCRDDKITTFVSVEFWQSSDHSIKATSLIRKRQTGGAVNPNNLLATQIATLGTVKSKPVFGPIYAYSSSGVIRSIYLWCRSIGCKTARCRGRSHHLFIYSFIRSNHIQFTVNNRTIKMYMRRLQ